MKCMCGNKFSVEITACVKDKVIRRRKCRACGTVVYTEEFIVDDSYRASQELRSGRNANRA